MASDVFWIPRQTVELKISALSMWAPLSAASPSNQMHREFKSHRPKSNEGPKPSHNPGTKHSNHSAKQVLSAPSLTNLENIRRPQGSAHNGRSFQFFLPAFPVSTLAWTARRRCFFQISFGGGYTLV